MKPDTRKNEEKKFEFLDITTADVCFVAYGCSLNELFANAALAMFEVMVDTSRVKPMVKREVRIKSYDLQSLMFDWLNELLVFVDAERLVFSKFDVKLDEKNFTLSAECSGEEIDLKKHRVKTHVKAATYHKLEIKKDKVWQAQVILDI